MNQYWSWLLAAVGITGIWLAGRNNKVGWAIGLGAQGLWLAYAVATEQWGFVATAIAYGFVYGRNWWRWYRADLVTAARKEEGKPAVPERGSMPVTGPIR